MFEKLAQYAGVTDAGTVVRSFAHHGWSEAPDFTLEVIENHNRDEGYQGDGESDCYLCGEFIPQGWRHARMVEGTIECGLVCLRCVASDHHALRQRMNERLRTQLSELAVHGVTMLAHPEDSMEPAETVNAYADTLHSLTTIACYGYGAALSTLRELHAVAARVAITGLLPEAEANRTIWETRLVGLKAARAEEAVS